jgi:hypothetical protein
LASLPTSCREDRFKVWERAPCCPSELRLVDRTIRAQVDLISACFGHERYRARVLSDGASASLLSAQIAGIRVAVIVEGGAAGLAIRHVLRVVSGADHYWNTDPRGACGV